jgi:hypothetical protein
MYTSVEGGLEFLRQGEHDDYSSVAAGAITGALFKSTGEHRFHCVSEVPVSLTYVITLIARQFSMDLSSS